MNGTGKPVGGKPVQTGWIIIPVEVQVRDLMGRLLVGAIAAARGHRVLIGHDRVIRRLARHLPRGVILDKGLGMQGDRKVARYIRLGYTMTAADEEMTGIYSSPEYFLKTRLSGDTLGKAARWFAISELARRLAADQYPQFAAKFVATGLPRTDIWQPRFHELYRQEREAIRARHGDFILFCSNFGQIVHARRGAFLQQQFARHEKSYSGAADYNRNLERQLLANLNAFVEMLPKLREWFPERKLIVRPHPSENRNFWKDALSGVPGVEIQGEGIATPWILASSVLVHHGCTTGIEAELMGKPQVMYAPHRDDHHDSDVMRTFAPIAGDLEKLREIVASMLKGSRQYAKPRGKLEKYYASLTGPLVAEKIVGELERLTVPDGELPRYLDVMRFTPRHLWATFGPQTAKAAAYSRQKWYGTSLDEVRRCIAIMSKAASLPHEITAEEVFPQLFEIRRA